MSVPGPDGAHPADLSTTQRVWVLLGEKGGDDAQVMSLAEALGWPWEARRLRFRRSYKRRNIRLGASLRSLDQARSSPLTPPWPDLVISYGRRSVPVARWIRAQSSGKATLVHIGRPWGRLAWFDLVITTPQYALPASPNVLHNILPLNAPSLPRITAAASQWAPRLAHLPRPWLALLVGGDARPFVLDAEAAAALGRQASARASALGGSLLVATSRRTAAPAAVALVAAITGPAHAYRWRPDDPNNPYLGYLGLADRFMVTGDSASMLADACATGKPVEIVAVPERPDWKWRVTGAFRRRAKRATEPRRQTWAGRLYDWLVDLGLVTATRDPAALHAALVARGLATMAGAGGGAMARVPPDDLDRAVRRVQELMRGTVASAGAAAHRKPPRR